MMLVDRLYRHRPLRAARDREGTNDISGRDIYLDEKLVHHADGVVPRPLRVHTTTVRHHARLRAADLRHRPQMHARDGARDVIAVKIEVGYESILPIRRDGDG